VTYWTSNIRDLHYDRTKVAVGMSICPLPLMTEIARLALSAAPEAQSPDA
jgi:hypothetical protein